MQTCTAKDCLQPVYAIPDKSKKSTVQTVPNISVCYPTKQREFVVCYFHRRWPKGHKALINPRFKPGHQS